MKTRKTNRNDAPATSDAPATLDALHPDAPITDAPALETWESVRAIVTRPRYVRHADEWRRNAVGSKGALTIGTLDDGRVYVERAITSAEQKGRDRDGNIVPPDMLPPKSLIVGASLRYVFPLDATVWWAVLSVAQGIMTPTVAMSAKAQSARAAKLLQRNQRTLRAGIGKRIIDALQYVIDGAPMAIVYLSPVNVPGTDRTATPLAMLVSEAREAGLVMYPDLQKAIDGALAVKAHHDTVNAAIAPLIPSDAPQTGAPASSE